MTTNSVYIEKLDWVADFYFAVNCDNVDIIVDAFNKIYAPAKIIDRVSEKLSQCELNGGITYSNSKIRHSIVVIGLHSSPAQFLNSFTHELRHLADDIGYVEQMNTRGEPIAYLTGDIAELLIEDVQRYICTCKCHCN